MAHDGAMQGYAADMPEMAKANDPSQSFAARLLDWLGRFHPMLVHFPIAFIPAALFTAIVGRRRPGFAKPVQFLVVTAGVTAPFAMLSGWLSGGFELGLDDWVMQSHGWLGTGIGLGAFALGVVALKRPEQDRASGMIVGLTILTAAILVQGWFGGESSASAISSSPAYACAASVVMMIEIGEQLISSFSNMMSRWRFRIMIAAWRGVCTR